MTVLTPGIVVPITSSSTLWVMSSACAWQTSTWARAPTRPPAAPCPPRPPERPPRGHTSARRSSSCPTKTASRYSVGVWGGVVGCPTWDVMVSQQNTLSCIWTFMCSLSGFLSCFHFVLLSPFSHDGTFSLTFAVCLVGCLLVWLVCLWSSWCLWRAKAAWPWPWSCLTRRRRTQTNPLRQRCVCMAGRWWHQSNASPHDI